MSAALPMNEIREVMHRQLLVDPTHPNHYVAKRHLDTVMWPGVRLAATAPISGTYDAGTNSIAITLPLTVDGVEAVNGDRILVTGQADLAENGIYMLDDATPALVRSVDAKYLEHFYKGKRVAVAEGTLHTGQTFELASLPPTATVKDIEFKTISQTEMSSSESKVIAVSDYDSAIGNAATYVVYHGLGTKNIDVVCYDNDTDQILAGIGVKTNLDDAELTLDLAAAAAAGVTHLRVVMLRGTSFVDPANVPVTSTQLAEAIKEHDESALSHEEVVSRVSVVEGARFFDASAVKDGTVFKLTAALQDDVPGRLTLRFAAPDDFVAGDTLTINDVETQLYSEKNEAIPDGAWKSGAEITITWNPGREAAFFKVGGSASKGAWNIFPHKTSGAGSPPGLYIPAVVTGEVEFEWKQLSAEAPGTNIAPFAYTQGKYFGRSDSGLSPADSQGRATTAYWSYDLKTWEPIYFTHHEGGVDYTVVLLGGNGSGPYIHEVNGIITLWCWLYPADMSQSKTAVLVSSDGGDSWRIGNIVGPGSARSCKIGNRLFICPDVRTEMTDGAVLYPCVSSEDGETWVTSPINPGLSGMNWCIMCHDGEKYYATPANTAMGIGLLESEDGIEFSGTLYPVSGHAYLTNGRMITSIAVGPDHVVIVQENQSMLVTAKSDTDFSDAAPTASGFNPIGGVLYYGEGFIGVGLTGSNTAWAKSKTGLYWDPPETMPSSFPAESGPGDFSACGSLGQLGPMIVTSYLGGSNLWYASSEAPVTMLKPVSSIVVTDDTTLPVPAEGTLTVTHQKGAGTPVDLYSGDVLFSASVTKVEQAQSGAQVEFPFTVI